MPAENPAPITCVIVDDHPARCRGMRLLVETDVHLHVVGEAADGNLALELLRTLRPDVALVNAALTTALDGFTTIERSCAEHLPTRSVMYSEQVSGEHVRRAFESGAYGFVSKMSPYGTIHEALRAAADDRRYVDPTVGGALLRPCASALSVREQAVLEHLAAGMQNAGMAFDMGVSSETIKTHVANVFGKLRVQTRAAAVAQGFRTGILV